MILQFVKNGIRNLISRWRADGWRAVVIWLSGHGIPKLTGIPSRQYSQITPNIYVGAQFRQAGKARLKDWGVTHTVNMREEFDDVVYDLTLAHYCYLPTVDHYAPTIAQLAQGIAFIQ